MNQNEKKWSALIAVLIVFYISLRFYNLTAACLWFDEIFGVHAATREWSSLFLFVAQDLIHPPLFYVLLKIWISAGGESLAWLRFFPFLFSILALIPFSLLCRELRLSTAAIALALLFFASNGALLKYSQEVRMYSLLVFLSLVSLWLFVRFLNVGKGFWALAAANILLAYTHYHGWLVVFAEVFAVFLVAREKITRILLMFGIAFAAFTPWIYAISWAMKINSDFNQNLGWASKPDLPTVFHFLMDLHEPVYFLQSGDDLQTIFWLGVPVLLTLMLAFALYFGGWKKLEIEEKRRAVLLLLFILVPISISFAASWMLPVSVWGTRHSIAVFAPYAILAAVALSKIRFRPVKFASLSLIVLLTGVSLLLQLRRGQTFYTWCTWERLAADLPQTQSDSGAPPKIYVFEDLVAYHFWFALRDADKKFQVVKINGIRGLAEDKAYFLPRGFDEIKITDENGFAEERFWIAFRAKNWNEAKPPLRNLTVKGYKIGAPVEIEAQGLKSFLVEIKREN